MGIYDRDYVRDERQGVFLGGDWSAVTALIVANVAIYLVDWIGQLGLSRYLGLYADLFRHPWQVYQLLTYGFLHGSPMHVGFNMFGLWLFGRDVEAVSGRAETLRIYFSLIVLTGLAWVVSHNMLSSAGVIAAGGPPVVGASGAVVGITVLFALHFPMRMIYIWGIFPVPAWLLATIYIVSELAAFGQVTQGGESLVAHDVHLAGAALAYLYYRTGWNLSRWLPSRLPWKGRLGRPRLRVHDERSERDDLSAQVDEILEKISREGEESLTSRERRTLQEASRKYQQRRR